MLVSRMRSSAGSLPGLFALLQKARAGCGCALQVFDPESIASERHLELALLLAKKSFAEKKNIAKTLGNEWLLFAAASAKMDAAIRRCGAKDAGDFLLAADCGEGEKKKLMGILAAREKKISFADAKAPAERFGLSAAALRNFSAEELVLEKIALSRLA